MHNSKYSNEQNRFRKKRGFRGFCERHAFKPSGLKWVLLTLIIIPAVSAFVGISAVTAIRSRTVNMSLKNIGELATQAGYYTNVQTIQGSRELFGISIPLTEKRYVFGYDGVIKAGYDFGEIEVTVDEINHILHVKLPVARILSNEVDENSFELFDENRNIFNTLKMEDINTSMIALKEEAEKKAIENGILESARSNAENLLLGFIAGTYDLTVYTVEFD